MACQFKSYYWDTLKKKLLLDIANKIYINQLKKNLLLFFFYVFVVIYLFKNYYLLAIV